MLEAAGRGDLDVLYLDGSNMLEILPDPEKVAAALERVPLRVHQDVVLTSQMLLDGAEVILLPVATRYEQEGGGTSTTTERRIAFSPQVLDPPAEARSEWRIFAELASRVRPELATAFNWSDNHALRTEIAEVVPLYAGIETLAATGDSVQYGGRHLCRDGVCPTVSGRAQFSLVEGPRIDLNPGEFWCSTRRGKQFNSMVYAEVDPLTGAGRDAVYIDATEAASLGIGQGDRVMLRSDHGHFEGTAHLVPLAARSVQVHWPEGNSLLGAGASHREPLSRIPDYNAIVRIHKVTTS
jgi:predicted molibdopterin-dependent oxidoreductase YjgC